MVMPQEDVGLAWNRNRWMQYSIAPQAPIPMAKNASTSEPPVPCSKDWRAVHATSGSHIVGTIHQGVLVKFSIHSFSKNRKLIRCCGRYTHWLYLSPSCPTWATTGRSRFTSIASAPRAAHVFFSDAPSLRPSTSTRTSTTNRDTRRSVHVNSCRVYGSLPSSQLGPRTKGRQLTWCGRSTRTRTSDERRRHRASRRMRSTRFGSCRVDRWNSAACNRTLATVGVPIA